MKYLFFGVFIATLFSCQEHKTETSTSTQVKYVGAMKNVMKKGELNGTIQLDTISPNENLFAIGPVEYLQGEITVFNGRSFVSKVESDSTMTISETFGVKAPFLVYANVKNWKEIAVPNNVVDLISLENFLNSSNNSENPFSFKIEADIEQATIHIVNLPAGTKVSSHEEAHQGQVNYILKNKTVDLIGFYSTKHHAVFTHHDTNMHIHLITKDQKEMGHLENLVFKRESVKLFLPTE